MPVLLQTRKLLVPQEPQSNFTASQKVRVDRTILLDYEVKVLEPLGDGYLRGTTVLERYRNWLRSLD